MATSGSATTPPAATVSQVMKTMPSLYVVFSSDTVRSSLERQLQQPLPLPPPLRGEGIFPLPAPGRGQGEGFWKRFFSGSPQAPQLPPRQADRQPHRHVDHRDQKAD